ncbi:MAG: ribokinase [Cyanobacteriota bacterium]|nr:ribokinase [Cyanobacteriota bacterium]
MGILVFGSLNMDLVAQTPQLPRPGETCIGRNFLTVPGGKGANQAVAAARLGAETYMVGRVGGDRVGTELLASLRESGVETEGILIDADASSGVALIIVSDRGENQIIVVPGANERAGPPDIQRAIALFPQTTLILLQLEVPLNAIIAIATAAKQAGLNVMLDPAPAPDRLPAELYPLIDFLVPNQIEASQLVGFAVQDRESATRAAQEFCDRGVGTAIVKLGDRGLVWATATDSGFVAPFPVQAIDTVAAGDAFAGAFAVALQRGIPLEEALHWGAAAGALSATRSGAQASLPNLETLETFMQRGSKVFPTQGR